MRSVRNRFGLALALALAVSAVVALPAQAADIDGSCALNGEATTAPPVQLQGGSGTYEFTDLIFACVGTVDGEVAVATFDVTSQGDYVNEICGTGTAEDSDASGTVVNEAPSSAHVGQTTPPLAYDIEFTSGVGTLTFTSGGTGSGVIDIFPTGPQANGTDCTDSFGVAGEVSLATTIG